MNGSKIFITNAGTDISAFVTITARTGEEEISNIVVPNGTAGYGISPPMDKLGWRASDTRELSFADCAVPEDHLLGPRGEGFHQFLRILDGGRISVAAMGLGLAQGAYDLALAYARERQQFGRPIAKFQAVQHNLATLAGEVAAASAAADAAAEACALPAMAVGEVAIAKVRGGEAAGTGAAIAHQVHGAMGFTYEHSLHHATRRLWSWREEFGNEAVWAARLGRPGTVVVLDNIGRDGDIVDPASTDPKVAGTRAGLEMLGRDPRFDATALQMGANPSLPWRYTRPGAPCVPRGGLVR